MTQNRLTHSFLFGTVIKQRKSELSPVIVGPRRGETLGYPLETPPRLSLYLQKSSTPKESVVCFWSISLRSGEFVLKQSVQMCESLKHGCIGLQSRFSLSRSLLRFEESLVLNHILFRLFPTKMGVFGCFRIVEDRFGASTPRNVRCNLENIPYQLQSGLATLKL